MLTEAGVAVVPGTVFGPAGAGHVRLSYATDRAAIAETFDRIAIVRRHPVRTASREGCDPDPIELPQYPPM